MSWSNQELPVVVKANLITSLAFTERTREQLSVGFVVGVDTQK